MALASVQTVFGFGTVLDWRPTSFVNPFPPTRVCSVCGLVPSTVATLPCRHLLCQPCYDRTGGKSSHCPLDKQPFQEEDVVWTTFGSDSVLGRKVRCWNAEHGCDAEDFASAMLEHFASACQFHTASCPGCNNNVLHRDITVHLVSRCTQSCTREQPSGDNFANAFLEVKEALKKISLENGVLQTMLESLKERLDKHSAMAAPSTIVSDAMSDAVENTGSVWRAHTQATLAKHRLEFTSLIRDALAGNERTVKEVISQECGRNVLGLKDMIVEALSADRRMAEVGSSLSETSAKSQTAPIDNEARALQLLAAASLSINSDILNESVPYEWTIDDWTRFRARSCASLQYSTGNDGQPTFHYGYLIVPRLCCDNNFVWLRVYVIKGLFDRFLTWPMDKNISLLFSNPSDCTRNQRLRSVLKWISHEKSLLLFNKEVVLIGRSQAMPFNAFRGHSLIENNKIRLRIHFER